MPSPICLVKDGAGAYQSTANGVNATPANTVTIKLASTAGVKAWQITCISTDETSSASAVTSALSVNLTTYEATFTAPAAGKTYRFRSVVNSGIDENGILDSTYVTTFGVFTLTASGLRVLAVEETVEASAAFGWSKSVNEKIRETGGGGGGLGSATPQPIGTTGSAGTATDGSHEDHVHALAFATVNTVLGTASADIGVNNRKITSLADGTAASHAATVGQLDTAIAAIDAGQKWKAPVRVVSTSNLTLSGTQTIDGVAVVAGNRVGALGQTTAVDRGIYVVAAGAWTRATDMAAASSAGSATFYAQEGTVNAEKKFLCTNDAGSDVVGIDALTFINIPSVEPNALAYRKEIVLFTGVASVAGNTHTRISETYIDLSPYPATIGSLTRTVTLKASIEKVGPGSGEVQIWNSADFEAVTGTTLTTTSETSVEVSAVVTVGVSAGNLKSGMHYRTRVRSTDASGTGTCTSARFVITYA